MDALFEVSPKMETSQVCVSRGMCKHTGACSHNRILRSKREEQTGHTPAHRQMSD